MEQLIIVKKNVKNMTLRIKADGSVITTAPKSFSDVKIHDFVKSKSNRIAKNIARMTKAKQEISLQEGQLLLHREVYNICQDTKLGKKVIVDNEHKLIRSGLDLADPETQLKRYKSYAKSVFKQRLDELSAQHGFTYHSVIIRDSKTRRGSCSSKKNIGLSRRLIKTPPFAMNYVICHELAHLRQMNHSPKFWAEVDRIYDDKEKAIAWMKKYGASLH